jgi:hypothetical protein
MARPNPLILSETGTKYAYIIDINLHDAFSLSIKDLSEYKKRQFLTLFSTSCHVTIFATTDTHQSQ